MTSQTPIDRRNALIAAKRGLLWSLEHDFRVLGNRLNSLQEKRAYVYNTPEEATYDAQIAELIDELEELQAKLYGVEDWLIDNDPRWMKESSRK